MKRSFLVLGLLSFSTTCFGQTTTTDSQTLQALLSEIRLLRQDMQTTTIAAQRAQFSSTGCRGRKRLSRASQRLDDARDKLARIQDERKHVASDVKQTEDFINNTENPATQRKELEDRVRQLKTRLELLESEEQQRQTREIERPSNNFERKRLDWSDLRDQLERLDKALENASRRTAGGPRE